MLTLGLSAGVLALLAQFRFPDQPRTQAASPPALALDQLATRGAFDDESRAMRELARRLSGSLVRLRLEGGGARDELLGLRIRDDVALVPAIPTSEDRRFEAVASDRWVAAPVVGRDYPRGLAAVRVPPLAAPVVSVADAPPQLPGYVAALGGWGAGPDIRPVWIGHLGVIPGRAWQGTVMRIPTAVQALPAGSLLFTVAGTFIGAVAPVGGESTIVPGQAVLERGGVLAAGRRFLGADAGVVLQDLTTPALRRAAGNRQGALVSDVVEDGPADGQLTTGDLIVRVDGEPVTSRSDVENAMQRREPGASATLTIMRRGQPATVTLKLAGAREASDAAAGSATSSRPDRADLGATLRRVAAGATAVVAVRPGSPAAAAGLESGDRITWIQGDGAITPDAIERTFRQLEQGGVLLLRIERNPAEADGSSGFLVAIER